MNLSKVVTFSLSKHWGCSISSWSQLTIQYDCQVGGPMYCSYSTSIPGSILFCREYIAKYTWSRFLEKESLSSDPVRLIIVKAKVLKATLRKCYKAIKFI